MKNSSWTGRAPRTLQAAFGPHTSRQFIVQSRVNRRDWWLGVLLAVAVGVVIAVLIARSI